jgi:hypothetical protein
MEFGYLPHCAQKVAHFPEKSDFVGKLGIFRYLNVVYKVPDKSCIRPTFPPDLQSSEVVSWDDLSRGNKGRLRVTDRFVTPVESST